MLTSVTILPFISKELGLAYVHYTSEILKTNVPATLAIISPNSKCNITSDRNVKEMRNLAKSVIFGNTPEEKWFGPKIVVPWNFLKNRISTVWDSFHGGASPSYDNFFSVTDMDKMLTLNCSHSEYVYVCIIKKNDNSAKLRARVPVCNKLIRLISFFKIKKNPQY